LSRTIELSDVRRHRNQNGVPVLWQEKNFESGDTAFATNFTCTVDCESIFPALEVFFRRTTHGEGCSQFMRANSAEKKSHRENTAFAIDCTVLLSNVPLMTTAMYVGISVCLYVKVFLDALAGNTFMYSQRSCQVSCVSSV
jgi:hypothetical protein